jgi:protein-disulfide isomerase
LFLLEPCAAQADQVPGTPSELQARTVEHVRTQLTEETVVINEEKEAKSTTAFYERDEVTGPLKGAEGKEDSLAGYNNAPTTKREVEEVRKTKKREQEVRGA